MASHTAAARGRRRRLSGSKSLGAKENPSIDLSGEVQPLQAFQTNHPSKDRAKTGLVDKPKHKKRWFAPKQTMFKFTFFSPNHPPPFNQASSHLSLRARAKTQAIKRSFRQVADQARRGELAAKECQQQCPSADEALHWSLLLTLKKWLASTKQWGH